MARPGSLSNETSAETQRLLVESWWAMPAWQKANRLSQDCERLALAGIRAEAPGLDERGVRFQLAIRRLGRALARQVFGNRGSLAEPL